MDTPLVGQDGEPGPGQIRVDIPDERLSPADELKAQQIGASLEAELAKTREILDADALANLVAPRARLEKHFERLYAWFFTIDGVLAGRKIQGALFAGECILVNAVTEAEARDVANRGLRATIELIHEEFDTRNTRATGNIEPGMVQEIGGRRLQADPDGALNRLQQKNPKLMRIIEDVMQNGRQK